MKTVTYLTVTALTILIVLKTIDAISLSWWIVGIPFYFIAMVALIWVVFKKQIERVIREG